MFSKKFNTQYGYMTCFSNDVVFRSSLENGKLYEEDLIIHNIIPLFKDLNESTIILDIGSHIGTHALLYSRLIQNSKIYAFEPQK
jgi:hypothetical protein